jgi:exosortase/archaeosortase family protein
MENTLDNLQLEKQKRKKLLLFIGKFLLIVIAYYSIVLFLSEELFAPYVNATAYLSSLLIRLFYDSVTVSGNFIGSGTSFISLSFGCEGTEPLVIFIAAMVGFPIAAKQKLMPTIAGVGILYFLNLIRVLGLFIVNSTFPSIFVEVHEIYFPIIFIIFAFVQFFISLKWSLKNTQK